MAGRSSPVCRASSAEGRGANPGAGLEDREEGECAVCGGRKGGKGTYERCCTALPGVQTGAGPLRVPGEAAAEAGLGRFRARDVLGLQGWG